MEETGASRLDQATPVALVRRSRRPRCAGVVFPLLARHPLVRKRPAVLSTTDNSKDADRAAGPWKRRFLGGYEVVRFDSLHSSAG